MPPAQYPTPKLEINFEDDPSPGFYDIVQAWTPLAYWRLDESAGTNANDSGSGNYDGTYTGGVTLNQSGVLADGNASASFDGTDDWVSVAYASAFQNLYVGTGKAWTVAAWIYPTAARDTEGQYAGIIRYTRSTGNVPFSLNYGRNDASFAAASCVWCGYFRNDVVGGTWFSVADPTPVRLNEWQHYVAVAQIGDSGYAELILYRNGMRVAGPAAQASGGGAGDASQLTRIGDRGTGTGNYFPGRIDEVVLFDRALTEIEVAKLHASSFSTLTKTASFVSLPPVAGSLSRILAFSTRRGRQDATARVEAGEAIVVLDNRDDLLSPDPLANLVSNPSFEEDVTSFWKGLLNPTLTRSTVRAQAGSASCQVTSSSAGDTGLTSGSNQGLTCGLRPGRTYTFSAYVYVPTGEGITSGEVFIRITDEVSGSGQTTTGPTPLGALDSWQRISVTRTIRPDADEAYIEIGWNAGAANEDMWIDACMLEESSSASTYADGEQADCRWNAQRHLSPTHRKQTGSYRNIVPMRTARLSCDYDAGGGSVNYKLIEGPITSVRYRYPDHGSHATVELSITDGMAALASEDLAGFARPKENTATRVAAVLKAGGVPAAKVSVDGSSCDSRDLAAISAGALTGTTPLEYLRKIEETEGGLFYIKGDGTRFYHGRNYRLVRNREEVAITDASVIGAAPVPYVDTAIAYDEQNVTNASRITNLASDWVGSVVKPDSMRRYWARSGSGESRFAEPVAVYQPRSEAIPRLEPVVLAPAINPSVLWPLVLGLEISDLIRVDRTVTRNVLRDYLQWVEGIEHNAVPGDWRTLLHTSSEIVTGAPAVTIVASGISTPVKVNGGSSSFEGGGHAAFSIPSALYRAGHLYCLTVLSFRNTTPVPSTPTTSTPTMTQIRTDSNISGSNHDRYTSFWHVPTSDLTSALSINTSGDLPFTIRWCLFEIAYGFNTSSPIGATNFATGSGTSGSVDVGTLASVYSRVLTHVRNTGGGTASWGRFFEIHEETGASFGYAAAYGPEGTDVATVTYGAGEGWMQQSFEVKAQVR